jgi:hypothetical protein
VTVATAEAPTCGRCGAGLAAGQEYCLGCGIRLPGPGRFGPPPLERKRLLLPLVLLAAVALTGAVLAIGLTRDPATSLSLVTLTGGVVEVPVQTSPAAPALAAWPRDAEAWTVVLLSVPKVDGRNVAAQAARDARGRGLRGVGVLDSSRFASLHPGYWLVFVGRYDSEAEATSRLRESRVVRKTARVQHVAG